MFLIMKSLPSHTPRDEFARLQLQIIDLLHPQHILVFVLDQLVDLLVLFDQQPCQDHDALADHLDVVRRLLPQHGVLQLVLLFFALDLLGRSRLAQVAPLVRTDRKHRFAGGDLRHVIQH